MSEVVAWVYATAVTAFWLVTVWQLSRSESKRRDLLFEHGDIIRGRVNVVLTNPDGTTTKYRMQRVNEEV